MNKPTSTVEINGNRYDAVTGQLIGVAKKAAMHVKAPIGRTIDGFIRPAKVIARSAAKRSVHSLQRRPQRSKTLMRSTVKKTTPVKPESPLKSRTFSTDHARAARAAGTAKNAKVNRYGILPFSRSRAKSGEVLPPKGSAIVRRSAAVSASAVATLSSVSHNRLERLLDLAMAQADAHKRLLEHRRRSRRKLFGVVPRWLAVTLAIIIAGIIVGIFAWNKVPQASFKLAAAKANVDNASLPEPIDGYKVGAITASENAVITNVESTTDDSKKYIVKEQPTSQPTASLVATTAPAGDSSQVQTVQDQDKTYVLSQSRESNKSTAACTKGNNTFSIESVGLNDAELLKAAKNACKN